MPVDQYVNSQCVEGHIGQDKGVEEFSYNHPVEVCEKGYHSAVTVSKATKSVDKQREVWCKL